MFQCFFGDPWIGETSEEYYSRSWFTNQWQAREYLVYAYNTVVQPTDRVLWLGTSVKGNPEQVKETLGMMHGIKYLCPSLAETRASHVLRDLGFASVKESYWLVMRRYLVSAVSDPSILHVDRRHDAVIYSDPHDDRRVTNKGVNVSMHAWGRAPVTEDKVLYALEEYKERWVE